MPKNQEQLKGLEEPSITEIEDAAEDYKKLRDKRMKILDQEIAAKAKLLETMKENIEQLSVDAEGNRVYRYDEELVILSEGKVNVKVKHVRDQTEEEE